MTFAENVCATSSVAVTGVTLPAVRFATGMTTSATVTGVHAPQLSFSLLSSTSAVASAQARRYQVPAVRVYEPVATRETPTFAADVGTLPRFVALAPAAEVARWKRVWVAPAFPTPLFVTVAEKLVAIPALAVAGVTILVTIFALGGTSTQVLTAYPPYVIAHPDPCEYAGGEGI